MEKTGLRDRTHSGCWRCYETHRKARERERERERERSSLRSTGTLAQKLRLPCLAQSDDILIERTKDAQWRFHRKEDLDPTSVQVEKRQQRTNKCVGAVVPMLIPMILTVGKGSFSKRLNSVWEQLETDKNLWLWESDVGSEKPGALCCVLHRPRPKKAIEFQKKTHSFATWRQMYTGGMRAIFVSCSGSHKSSLSSFVCCVIESSFLEPSSLGSTTHVLSHSPLKLHL